MRQLEKTTNITDNFASRIITIQDEVISRYENNINIITETENEQQDLLHEIELSLFNAHKGYTLAKSLQDVRKRRREAKNENELLEEFYVFCKEQKSTQNKLKNIIGKSRQVHKKQCNRNYVPRIRNDLTITDVELEVTELGEKLKNLQ